MNVFIALKGTHFLFLFAYMLVDPITGVLNGCRHKKGTGLIVKKLLFIQN